MHFGSFVIIVPLNFGEQKQRTRGPTGSTSHSPINDYQLLELVSKELIALERFRRYNSTSMRSMGVTSHDREVQLDLKKIHSGNLGPSLRKIIWYSWSNFPEAFPPHTCVKNSYAINIFAPPVTRLVKKNISITKQFQRTSIETKLVMDFNMANVILDITCISDLKKKHDSISWLSKSNQAK